MKNVNNNKTGLFFAILTYTVWGTLPVFWKFLSAVPSIFVQTFRMIGCFACVIIFCAITKKFAWSLFRNKRAVITFLISGALITVNWTSYIITVNSGNVVESALGYYITPLFNIMFGLIIFKEKLSPCQIIATILAAAGIVFFTVSYGKFPFMAINLALTFGAYGAVKKWGGYPASDGMFLESTFTGIAGFIGLIVFLILPDLPAQITPVTAISPLAWQDGGIVLGILLLLAGLATWVPLQTFAIATNKIPLSWVGFCQYWSPTLALILGVFLFNEPFTFSHAVMFACIWGGIVLIIIEAIFKTVRKKKRA